MESLPTLRLYTHKTVVTPGQCRAEACLFSKIEMKITLDRIRQTVVNDYAQLKDLADLRRDYIEKNTDIAGWLRRRR